jgi:hypothetical protein
VPFQQQPSSRTRKAFSPGVTHTVLWRDGDSIAGLMWVDAGAAVPEHSHEQK